MMPTMTLEEIVRTIDTGEERRTICARKPWTADSEAILVTPNARGGLPPGTRESGFAYFLEVHIAREILAPYLEKRPRTPKEKLDFLIYYAENDAFPDDDD